MYVSLNDKTIRLKEPMTIPPMSLLTVSFKIKRQQGDTIVVTERGVPQGADSLVTRIEIPEKNEKEDSVDYKGYFLTKQLNPVYYNTDSKNSIYDDLKFEDGVCTREFVVHNAFMHANILRGELTEDMKQIMKAEDVPLHVIDFTYGMNFYTVSVSNDCDLSILKKKDKKLDETYRVRIKFYENVRHPYHQSVPFAIIESVAAA